MRRIFLCCLVLLAADAPIAWAGGQMMPGGGGQMSGRPGMNQGMGPPGEEISSAPAADKPDAAAKKAYAAGVKALAKAKEYEEAADKAPNPDKKSRALEKVGDSYNKALDQFTEALRNKGDMVDAWNNIGYVHMRLGAYREAVDDYNHTLALKPDLLDAILHRGEAYLVVDRLDDAKGAYMDLFYHARPLADQLMAAMQAWLEKHRASANGMSAADIDSFGKWLQERGGMAKSTASNPQGAPNSQGTPSPH